MAELAPALAISEAEMFRAVLAADPAYDERFFTAVVTTGVFCFPSCSCRKPRRENVRFFATRDEATVAGFRPCKRCLSDRVGGRRAYEAQLLAQVRALVDQRLDTVAPAELGRALALSPDYLGRLMRRHTGLSLQAYVRQQRALRAAGLLRQGDHSVLEAAGAVGFESASGFYAAFTELLGTAPGKYRRATAGGAHS